MAGLESIQINLLEIINEMNEPRERKEELCLALFGLTKEEGQVMYEGDIITGVQLRTTMERISIMMTVSPDGTVEVKKCK